MTENFIGDAGAGMVKVELDKNFTIVKVEIDPTVFANTAPEILNDLSFMANLFKSAVNQAIEKSLQNTMNKSLDLLKDLKNDASKIF